MQRTDRTVGRKRRVETIGFLQNAVGAILSPDQPVPATTHNVERGPQWRRRAIDVCPAGDARGMWSGGGRLQQHIGHGAGLDPLIEAGRIKPQVYKTFALAEAPEAHRLMESSQHIGKIILTL